MSNSGLPDDTPLPSSLGEDFFEENRWQKLVRKLKREPLIPLGCAATTYALWRAYKSMKAGDSVQLNKMFRARIYAQAFTLCAVGFGGIYYAAERRAEREIERAIDEKKGQEKRDAWLRELEIRDQEDRNWRERNAAIEAAANAKDGNKKVSDIIAEKSVDFSAPEGGKEKGILEQAVEKK
ncbi:Hypoxia induced family protein [Ascosphaera apis ARSEF 7405]|uniref:Respiratory supercomplex factor 1, mitochondrial n=1 Tax=Ascosphaera apis ARSEF 7405 TaxID=392613 RepID=A0A168C8H5_9EURO|nr:Hypoxia induced family protein [Ascosphaera apis ARSEF 7405]